MAARAVALPAPAAAELLSALDAEASAKQRELTRLSQPPLTPHDLCRAFARALDAQLQRRGRAILSAFSAAPGGFAAALRAAPLAPLFAPARVRDVCATADGFQPYLVSPEAGLRALVRQGVELFRPSARACVVNAYDALAAAVAAAVASAAETAHDTHRPKCEVRCAATRASNSATARVAADEGLGLAAVRMHTHHICARLSCPQLSSPPPFHACSRSPRRRWRLQRTVRCPSGWRMRRKR
jgi:hypothetical protein